MGGAIASGLAKSGVIKASDIIVADPNAKQLMPVAQTYGYVLTTDNVEAVLGSDVIIIAVKPWLVEQVLGGIAPRIDFRNQILLSIAAGVTLDDIDGWLSSYSSERTLFRAMPNTAIAIRQSMTFLCQRNASVSQIETVERIFGALGKVAVIEERLMGAATALCSCGIAYAMRYVRAATEGGVELGFYASQGKDFVLQTLRGAIELLEATGNNPEVEIDKVTTPGGVTIKGLNAMESKGFTTAIIEGLKASK